MSFEVVLRPPVFVKCRCCSLCAGLASILVVLGVFSIFGDCVAADCAVLEDVTLDLKTGHTLGVDTLFFLFWNKGLWGTCFVKVGMMRGWVLEDLDSCASVTWLVLELEQYNDGPLRFVVSTFKLSWSVGKILFWLLLERRAAFVAWFWVTSLSAVEVLGNALFLCFRLGLPLQTDVSICDDTCFCEFLVENKNGEQCLNCEGTILVRLLWFSFTALCSLLDEYSADDVNLKGSSHMKGMRCWTSWRNAWNMACWSQRGVMCG